MNKRRVVVTGVGAVTSIGNRCSDLWEGVLQGASGAASITRFDHSDYAVHFASEVKDFNPLEFLSAKEARHMDRFSIYGVAAADEAIKDSGIDLDQAD